MNLKKLENEALSDTQVMKLIDNKANFVVYPDIHKYQNIDQLLGPYGACVILYESKANYGHYCCVFKRGNELEFFNPYGSSIKEGEDGLPDSMLKFIDKDFRDKSNQNHTYLANLMYNSPYNLSYNQYPLQRFGEGIKTCGRHVASRLMHRGLSLDQYFRLIKKNCEELNLTPDQFVSYLTRSV
jgi:hypothetical protein